MQLLLRFGMRRYAVLAAVPVICVTLAGCHSHYIQVSIVNGSQLPLNVIQVDYPSASFGVQKLAAGETFHYRFKLLGSGPIKVTFIDAQNRDHAVSGPTLQEGQEGTLDIALTQDQASFHKALRP